MWKIKELSAINFLSWKNQFCIR